ncbi:MAG: response regulator transcription factor [Candidatus Hodarchaeales archaeon]|jgi:two-component system alkaline phosphatase synthesis response regulator PhoP
MTEKSILVVDDEDDTIELARMVLEFEGYRVFSASNGQDAIDFLKKSDEKPDLILLDVLMPKIDGLEVCKWIKRQSSLKSIPILLFTAKVGKKDRIAGEEAGADAYINKPFSAEDLLSLIRNHLEISNGN